MKRYTVSLSLRHVEVFHALMISGSVTKAAELLRTSQPTVSRELAAFERLLGFSLFERRSRRLYATEKAIRLHAEVQRSHVGLRQLAQAAQAIRDNTSSLIEFACLPLFAQTVVPRICKRFLSIEPEVRLVYRSLDQPVLLRELVDLRYEFGLVEVGAAVDGVQVDEIALGEEVCILPRGHRLARRHTIEPSDLVREPLVSFTADDLYRRRFHSIFEDAGLTRNIRVETTTAEAVCALVQQGVGVALINPLSARAYRDRGIVIRPFSVSIPFVAGICRPLGRPINQFVDTISHLLAEECRSLAAELRPASP